MANFLRSSFKTDRGEGDCPRSRAADPRPAIVEKPAHAVIQCVDRMRSEDLSPEQYHNHCDQLGYLTPLRGPMERKGFPQTDPLLVLVNEAIDAVHRRWVAAHSLSCDGTVARPFHRFRAWYSRPTSSARGCLGMPSSNKLPQPKQ